MAIEIKPVIGRRDLKQFVRLPARIHSGRPNWVPPIYPDDMWFFNRRKNRAFEESAAILALACKNGLAVGRIMGIINHRLNRHRREQNARFGFLECPDDQEIAHHLLRFVEDWAKQAGMEKIIGPMGFSDQDPEGFQIEGFEQPPSLATCVNGEFILRLLEKEGYGKEVDYVVYKLDLGPKLPEFYRKIGQRICRRQEYRLLEFQKRKQLRPFIHPILRLMNVCFKDLYGYLSLDEEEMDSLAKRYLPLLDPRFVKIISKGSEIVAFVISMPNLSEGIRRAHGHLLPTGIFKILSSARKAKQLDLLLGGVREDCRGRGLDVLMGCGLIEQARQAGLEYIDSHHVLETNLRMRAVMERLGAQVYKRFRIFQKGLNDRVDQTQEEVRP